MTKKNSQLIIVILTLAVILSIGIGIASSNFQRGTVNKDITRLNIPVVESTLESSTDGKPHNVKTRFTVEVDKKLGASVTSNNLYSYLDEIMATLDYDRITARGSIDYITEEIMSGLQAYIDEETLKKVYITEIQTGENIIFTDSTEPNHVNTIFNALFGNGK